MPTTKETPLSQIFTLSELPWNDLRPGMKAKHLWEDPATQRRALLIRFEPGATIPLHRHVGDEIIFVIEGAVSDESGSVRAGNVGFRPNGCTHTVASPNGATVLAIVTGGTEPASAIAGAPPSRIYDLTEIPWGESRPGVQQKKVLDEPAGERRVAVSRFAPGAVLPLHRHVGDELVFVIEGANTDESGTLHTGNLNYRPNGCVHSVKTDQGATILAIVWGGVEPV